MTITRNLTMTQADAVRNFIAQHIFAAYCFVAGYGTTYDRQNLQLPHKAKEVKRNWSENTRRVTRGIYEYEDGSKIEYRYHPNNGPSLKVLQGVS